MCKLRLGIKARVVDVVGGRARLRVIAVLAGLLALDSADKATIGAVAPQLERDLGISNVQLGVIVAVTTGISALATLPLGIISDRANRVHLLTAAVLLWSVAVLVGGASPSYVPLLVTQVILGVGSAAAGPAVGSLIGDLFHPSERGRIYGFVLTGEILGAGLGFLVSGDIAAVLSWRYAFWCLGALGAAFALVVTRELSEPERGGGSQLPPARGSTAARADDGATEVEVIMGAGIAPREHLVLRDDPADKPLWWAVRYVLAVPTNLLLIAASGLGYFFFSGLRTFGVVFMEGRFDLPQGAASSLLVVIGSGAVVGTLLTGRFADRAIGLGHISARPVVAGASYLVAAIFFLPGLLVPGLSLAIPVFFLGAVGFGGANPPLDAARLDVMHYRLRGRAEAVRSVCRSALEALAPLCFGFVSVLFGATGTTAARPGADAGTGSALDHTFLAMLATLFAAGLLLCLKARSTYPRDVASALASEDRTRPSPDGRGGGGGA